MPRKPGKRSAREILDEMKKDEQTQAVQGPPIKREHIGTPASMIDQSTGQRVPQEDDKPPTPLPVGKRTPQESDIGPSTPLPKVTAKSQQELEEKKRLKKAEDVRKLRAKSKK